VAYNAEKTVSETVRSVLSQKGVELEYIVIDGASTDRTVACVREAASAFPMAEVRILSEKDDGLYDALNKGIRLATGDIIGILNADDVFDGDDALMVVVNAFDDSTDAIYGDIRFVDKGRTVRYYSARHWRPWMHRFGYMPPHPSVYIRREFFARLGAYRTDLRISADYELMVRYFCKNGVRTKYLPRCIVKMTPGGISTSGLRAMIRLNRENVRANRLNGTFSCFPMMLPKYLYKMLGLFGFHK